MLDAQAKYGLTEKDVSRLDGYVRGVNCYWINEKIYSGKTLNSSEQMIFDDIISSLMKFSHYSGRSYRNVKFDTEQTYNSFLEKYAEGQIVIFKTITSTSKKPNGYTKFGNGVVHLVIDGFSGYDISDSFGYKRQEEITYIPGTEMSVLKVTTANDGNPLIFLEEITDGKLGTEVGRDYGNEGPT